MEVTGGGPLDAFQCTSRPSAVGIHIPPSDQPRRKDKSPVISEERDCGIFLGEGPLID